MAFGRLESKGVKRGGGVGTIIAEKVATSGGKKNNFKSCLLHWGIFFNVCLYSQ